jgi:acetylornithine deacetylase/succinyl-diaminopimelate desuccinylase-like protein
MTSTWSRLAALACLCAAPAVFAANPPPQASATDPYNVLARDIFKQLIEIDTTDSVGSVTAASEAMAKRFRDAGFPPADVRVVGPTDRKKNLVVRLRGKEKHKPILMIGHLDVVEARREDWTTNPFEFVEKDGYFYGRGTQDMKHGVAIMATALLRMKKEKFVPSRDLILALTADEEGGKHNGVDWLFKNQRNLVDAEFVLNHDAYSVQADGDKLIAYELVSSEKVYADYLLTTTNPGGHSSLPKFDNAIYELVDGLEKIAKYEFPFELNNITRGYYESMAKIETGQRAADMQAILQNPPDEAAIKRLSQDVTDHAVMRTTCVATRLEAGHANNALPQRAQATINCRILPGHSPEEVRQDIIKILNSPKIKVQFISEIGELKDIATDRKGFTPPPLRPELMQPLQKLVKEYWPGLQIVPVMTVGASDDVYVNNAGLTSYTITGVTLDRNDDRSHGQDERLPVQSFYTGNEFFHRFLKTIATK